MTETKTHTYSEIMQQPQLWVKVIDIIAKDQKKIKDFLDQANKNNDLEVIFTGAGSSFFIGEIVAPFFQKDSGLTARAIETTEIVSHPIEHINPNRTTLMISFARSGNSPESVAAIQVAKAVSDNIKHINITCNKDGALAKEKGVNILTIILPEEANDKSLAMTSSVSSMALVALMIGRLDRLNEMKFEINKASKLFNSQIKSISSSLAEVSKKQYQRGIFLGSGPMKGVAHESHLKLQELTDGEIICKFDSFLGFRHGPKAVVNNSTMLVYFFSNNDYTRKYEIDLVEGIFAEQNPMVTIGISNKPLKTSLNFDIDLTLDDEILDDAIWTIFSLIPGQILGFYKSEQLGYNPDSPSKSGSIHRVVRGVNIYKFSTNGKTIINGQTS